MCRLDQGIGGVDWYQGHGSAPRECGSSCDSRKDRTSSKSRWGRFTMLLSNPMIMKNQALELIWIHREWAFDYYGFWGFSLFLSLSFSTSFKAGVRTLYKWFVHQSSGARILWVLVESCFELSHYMSVISHSLHTSFEWQMYYFIFTTNLVQVFDCWFESGSMPYAQSHYPFENKQRFETGFPADFIAEGLDQTRGWFYTLMVLSTALFDKPAWKNLIVNGLVLAADGKKMSK